MVFACCPKTAEKTAVNKERIFMDKECGFLDLLWSKYIISDEGLATLLIVLAIALKLLINCKVTKLRFKKMLVSLPSEITFLVIGFLLSALVRETYNDGIRAIMAIIVIALIIIIVQYAFERYLDDKLGGRIRFWNWVWIILMYLASLVLYYIVVFGGSF